MKIYVAGKITGLDNYKELFDNAVENLKRRGYKVMNPAVLPEGFEQEEYMKICYAMIDVCEGVFFLDNWESSKGANLEHEYAIATNKWIKYQ